MSPSFNEPIASAILGSFNSSNLQTILIPTAWLQAQVVQKLDSGQDDVWHWQWHEQVSRLHQAGDAQGALTAVPSARGQQPLVGPVPLKFDEEADRCMIKASGMG